MSAVPTSDMPGYLQLHERVYNALDRCQELPAIDFKESETWETLKWRLIKTLMGMGNLRDGGIIVIGAAERSGKWSLTGIQEEHLETYKVDDIIDAVNKYSSPPMEFEIVLVEYRDKKKFLTFQAREFEHTPYMCKKNSPDHIKIKNPFYEGNIFYRPPGKPQTKPVKNAQDMRDLLELAAEKHARRMIETAHKIGFVPSSTSTKQFDEELDQLGSSKVKLPVPVLEYPHWRVNFRPEEYDGEAIPSLGECFRIIERNGVHLRGWTYPSLSNRERERIQGSNYVGSWCEFMGSIEYWRFFQSKQFIHFFGVREFTEDGWREILQRDTVSHLRYIKDVNWDEVPGFFSILNFISCVTEIIEFAARLCQAEIYKGTLHIEIEVKKIAGFVLTTTWERSWRGYRETTEENLGKVWSIKTDSLIADSAQQSLEIVLWFFERFGWHNPSAEVIRKDIDDFLKGRL